MNKIDSFKVDHTKLEPGFYISRVDHPWDHMAIITYDLRTRKPNSGSYMTNDIMHSVEHLMATFLRNSEMQDSIIYFGPMGCQTGFYLVTAEPNDSLIHNKIFELVKTCIRDILNYEGPMPGQSALECGHYANLNLERAKIELMKYLSVLENVTSFNYQE